MDNSELWDGDNARGLLWVCLQQPPREPKMLELNCSVHPAGMWRLLGAFPSSWR